MRRRVLTKARQQRATAKAKVKAKASRKPRQKPRAGVRVIERAIDILLCLDESHEKLTLQEISERTGIHKATAFRILATLVDDGILDQPEPSGAYALGFFALRCADAILGADALRQRALPIMLQLRDELNETVVLARRQDASILNVDRVVSRHGIIETPVMGVRAPLHESHAGIAVLSTFAPDDLASYLDAVYPRRTSAGVRAVRARIGEAKALMADPAAAGAHEPVLAAPLVDDTGEAIGALSIAVPSGRAEPKLIAQCMSRLLWASQQLLP
jgi:DNA-binding IclR family transcriptional regulator